MIDVASVKEDKTNRQRQRSTRRRCVSDASFDAVVCQFGVMFFRTNKGVSRARRVLKPGGRYLFNVWDSLAHNEITDLVVSPVAEMFSNDPPQF